MTRVWHFLNAGEATQTAEEDTFIAHCKTGIISDATMVWTSGMDAWKTFAELRREQAAALQKAVEAKEEVQTAEPAPAADEVKQHRCAECGKDWPESLMVKPNRRWFCRSCFVKKTLAAQKAEKFKNEKGKPLYKNKWAMGGIVAALAAAYVATNFGVDFKLRPRDPVTQPPEKWAALPSGDWPPLSVAAEVQLRGRPSVLGVPNACLVQLSSQNTVAVGSLSAFQGLFANETNRAPAGSGTPAAARVTPDQLRAQLGAALTEWRLDQPGALRASFKKIRNRPADYAASQALLLEPLTPLPEPSRLPVTPLRPRTDPIQKDVRIYIIVSTPAKPGARQTVIPGKIHAAFDAKRSLDLEMPEPVNLKAMLGAPVIDEGGHFVGIVDGSYDAPDRNGLFQSISAESVLAFAAPLGMPTPTPAPEAQKPPAAVKK